MTWNEGFKGQKELGFMTPRWLPTHNTLPRYIAAAANQAKEEEEGEEIIYLRVLG